MIKELPKDWKRHHEFWSNEKSFKELDDYLNKVSRELSKGTPGSTEHKKWEDAQDDIAYARLRWKRVKADMRENLKENKKSLNEGLMLSVEDFGGDTRDLLNAYLNWHGIIGYTQDIMDIIEAGEVWVHDMDEEDLEDIKRRYGLYESKKKSGRKPLKESTEEIDRRLFGSLVKYSDPVFANATHGVLNDGVLVYKFWARNDEDAKEVFRKCGVRNRPEVDEQGYAIAEKLNEALVPATPEDIEFFEKKIEKLGYEIEGKGKTFMGSLHYQVISLFNNNDRSDLREFAKQLNFLSDEMDEREIPMTYNAGLTDDGYITAGIDLLKKWVPDEKKEESPTKKITKIRVDNTDLDDEEMFKPVFESRQLNEGPGAGYEISGRVGDVRIGDITITEDGTTDNEIYYSIEGDIELDLVDVECHSYYYGGNIPETTAKVEWLALSAGKDWELPTPTEEDVYDLLMSVDFKTVYGGGWSHSTFTNDLELDYNTMNYSSATYDIDKLEIKFTDEAVVDAIDKYATGENYDVEFSVLDEDEYEVEFFDNQEDAIAYAKEEGYPYVAETHWGWEYLGNGEYNTTDRVDSSEVIWTNDELEV